MVLIKLDYRKLYQIPLLIIMNVIRASVLHDYLILLSTELSLSILSYYIKIIYLLVVSPHFCN